QNALVASLSASDIKILQNFLDSPQTPPPAATTLVDDAGHTLSTNGQTAYQLILAGVRTYPIFQPVLKHTQMTSNVYAVQASFANVGKIISPPTLLATLPGVLAFTMPRDPAFVKPGFAYGWLKDYPNVTASAFNKTKIEQVFEFGLWNTTEFNTPL